MAVCLALEVHYRGYSQLLLVVAGATSAAVPQQGRQEVTVSSFSLREVPLCALGELQELPILQYGM